VKPVQNNQELSDLLGLSPQELFAVFAPAQFHRVEIKNKIPDLVLELKRLVDEKVLSRDVMKYNSWGVKNGKPILIDV